MSTIESQDLKLVDVFRDFYAVPNYQREYVWKEEEVEQLLLDVRSEHLDGADSEYFIGSIVVCRGKEQRFDLIDGQQRLTTVFITLCAIRDRHEKLGFNNTDHVRKLIAENTVDQHGVERFQARLDPQYDDAGDVFEQIVRGVAPSRRAPTRSMRNVAAAYDTVIEFLTAEFESDNAALRAFYGYLINKVKLIRITTDSIARALKIFETINDRGVGLDAMDLLKNLLFIKTPPGDFDRLKNKWKVLTDKLYNAGEKPLRFLRYYIFATFPNVGKLQEDQLYEWLVNNESKAGYGTTPLKFVDTLNEAADAYLNFLRGKGPDGNSHQKVESLSLLAGRSVRQHLIILLAARHLPPELFSAVCEDVENLVFVYLITRQPSREFEVYFLNWATEISSVTTVDEYRRLSAGTFAKRRAELAARFGREFPALDGRSLKQFQLRYLLGKLTQHIDLAAYGVTSAGHRWLSRYCDGGANQIEHILPQTPTASVEVEFGPGVNDAGIVWSIGNLALVESAINQSLGNTPFSHKRTIYPMSQLLLTRAISERPNIGKTAIDRAVDSLEPFSVWNAGTVRERAEMLTRVALSAWDIPPNEEPAGQSEPPRSGEQESKAIAISIPSQTKLAPNVTGFDDETKSLKRSGVQFMAQPNIPVTLLMRHYAETKETDHFGFSGLRAAIACLYARPEAATQTEVTQASALLGSPEQKYLNMLREMAIKWRHDVVVWTDLARGGKVYKLIFNPSHSAPRAVEPPANWEEMNLPKAPPGVTPTPLRPPAD